MTPEFDLTAEDVLIRHHARHEELLCAASTPATVGEAFVPLHLARCLFDAKGQLRSESKVKRQLRTEAALIERWRRESPDLGPAMVATKRCLLALANNAPKSPRGRKRGQTGGIAKHHVDAAFQALLGQGISENAIVEAVTRRPGRPNKGSITSLFDELVHFVRNGAALRSKIDLGKTEVSRAIADRVRDYRRRCLPRFDAPVSAANLEIVAKWKQQSAPWNGQLTRKMCPADNPNFDTLHVLT